MDGKIPSRWEGTHLYGRNTPGRKTRTASLVREEAAAKLVEEREKKKLLAEEKRRSLSVGSLSSVTSMSASKGTRRAPSRGSIPVPTPTNDKDSGSNTGAGADTVTGTENPGQNSDPAQANGASASMSGNQKQPGTQPDGNAPVDPPTNHGIDPAQAAFFLAMEARLKKASEKAAEDVAGLFRRNIERIDSNTKSIAEMKTQNTERDKKLDEK